MKFDLLYCSKTYGCWCEAVSAVIRFLIFCVTNGAENGIYGWNKKCSGRQYAGKEACSIGIGELYEENARLVYRYLYSVCRNEQLAEDLTQETFLEAYKSIERFDGSCKISSWLCQIAKHLLYRYYRKNRREAPAELEKMELADGGIPEQRVLDRLELLDVLKDMQKLPAATREVIYLRMTGELSFREIGEILGKSENWARVTFYRGKEILWKGRRKDE